MTSWSSFGRLNLLFNPSQEVSRNFVQFLKDREGLNPKGGCMQDLEFYDVKTKSKFKTDTFSVKEKAGRFFAVAKSPAGTHECWRVLGKDQAAQFKKK